MLVLEYICFPLLLGTSQNSLDELSDQCNVGDYTTKKENSEELFTKELWEESDNQDFSEELSENVCIHIFFVVHFR